MQADPQSAKEGEPEDDEDHDFAESDCDEGGNEAENGAPYSEGSDEEAYDHHADDDEHNTHSL